MNWSQLKTVLWLRWRLTRNQFARRGGLNAAISIIALIVGSWAAAGFGVGGFFAGWLALSKAPPVWTLLVWDIIIGVFLFVWMIGVLTEIQRSETIDLARLLHLPISLQGVFFINYVVSLVTFSMVLFFPAMMGICLGLLVAKGAKMVLMLPLVLSFIFMLTTWTYCLRGWLITLMVNPRRRRNVIMIITLSVVLLGQAPNLYFNVYLRFNGNQHHHSGIHKNNQLSLENLPPSWLTAHGYVPVLWVPNGAKALAEGEVMPALLGSLGAFLLGALGLARAYRTTMRFYTGQEKAKAVPVKTKTLPSGGQTLAIPSTLIEKRIPFVSEDVAGLTLALFRSLTRAPEIRIALFTNFLVIIILFAIVFSETMKKIPPQFQLFCATGAVAFTFFGLMQSMFNQFGSDRDGFRALVLSPTRRRDVLLAKNLSYSPFAIGLGATLLLLLLFVLHLSPWVVVAALFQLVAMFLLMSLAGNLISILVPYRVGAGSLKPTKPPAKVIFLILITQMLFPVSMVPIAIPPLVGIII